MALEPRTCGGTIMEDNTRHVLEEDLGAHLLDNDINDLDKQRVTSSWWKALDCYEMWEEYSRRKSMKRPHAHQ